MDVVCPSKAFSIVFSSLLLKYLSNLCTPAFVLKAKPPGQGWLHIKMLTMLGVDTFMYE